MAMMKCKECGEKISSKAAACPSCGAPIKKKRSGCLVVIIALFSLFIIGSFVPDHKTTKAMPQSPKTVAPWTSSVGSIECTLSSGSERELSIKNALNYLQDVSEIVWIEIDGNNVYLGFSQRPSDLPLVVKGVALRANEAINFGVHTWAVDARHRGWRAGDGSYWFETTARYGQIND